VKSVRRKFKPKASVSAIVIGLATKLTQTQVTCNHQKPYRTVKTTSTQAQIGQKRMNQNLSFFILEFASQRNYILFDNWLYFFVLHKKCFVIQSVVYFDARFSLRAHAGQCVMQSVVHVRARFAQDSWSRFCSPSQISSLLNSTTSAC
jgi:hypothetical protein